MLRTTECALPEVASSVGHASHDGMQVPVMRSMTYGDYVVTRGKPPDTKLRVQELGEQR